jgi:hypothetical protein
MALMPHAIDLLDRVSPLRGNGIVACLQPPAKSVHQRAFGRHMLFVAAYVR